MADIRNRRGEIWRVVGRIAARQHGVVSRDQLRQAGLTEAAIQQGVAGARLYPLFRSTFAVGHPRRDRHHRLVAAVLACGDGSVVSHGTAAALLGLWRFWPADIEVIAPVEAGRKIRGIRRRFAPPPPSEQIRLQVGIPCTMPSRTIIDVAGIAGRKLLTDTIEQAAVLEVLNVPEIDGILLEGRRRGEKNLKRVLEPWRRYTPRIRLRSRMEAKMLPLLTHHNLPIPETNVKLRVEREEFEVDFLWREQRVVVETDGGRYHDNPIAQTRDGHRNRVLARAGYRVPRIGWDELRDEPGRAIAEIRHFLHSPVVPYGRMTDIRNS
jgi:very-short-patch-repair endonuclease